jgi:hypothetical protein
MSEWQTIESAPKDGTRVDLYAKTWRAESDDFVSSRFPDCYWTNGDSMTNRRAHWSRLDTGWHPTHWMPLPDPPVASEGD